MIKKTEITHRICVGKRKTSSCALIILRKPFIPVINCDKTAVKYCSALWIVLLTLICLFSSLSLWASICSLLHSSMIFLTSPSSRVELSDFAGSTEESDLSKLDDIILLDSMSCCKMVREWQLSVQRVDCCWQSVFVATLPAWHRYITSIYIWGLACFFSPHTECKDTEPLWENSLRGAFHKQIKLVSISIICLTDSVAHSAYWEPWGRIAHLIMNWKQLLRVVFPFLCSWNG